MAPQTAISKAVCYKTKNEQLWEKAVHFLLVATNCFYAGLPTVFCTITRYRPPSLPNFIDFFIGHTLSDQLIHNIEELGFLDESHFLFAAIFPIVSSDKTYPFCIIVFNTNPSWMPGMSESRGTSQFFFNILPIFL